MAAYVTEDLQPAQWSYRLPFFATGTGATLELDGARPDVMCAEMAYATAHGIDHWVFVTYPQGTDLRQALDLYVNITTGQQAACQGRSPRRAAGRRDGAANTTAPDFALIVEAGRLETGEISVAEIVGLMQLPVYVRLSLAAARPRPLFYVLQGSAATTARVAALRSAAQAAGLGDPYVVSLSYGPVAAQAATMATVGADAISQYVVIAGAWAATPGRALPYAANADAEQAYWKAAAALPVPLVPTVAAGWDPRPREILQPMPWKQTFPPRCGNSTLCWVQDPSMAQLEAQTAAAVAFTRAHGGDVVPSRAILISAWNEVDEGHWILPSREDGPSKLQAIQRGLCTDC